MIMDLTEYQQNALKMSLEPVTEGKEMPLVIAMLGLSVEVNSTLAQFKKYLRDGSQHQLFQEDIEEELGDLLWYIAKVASEFDLDLNAIAKSNLKKCNSLWTSRQTAACFDNEFPILERLPRLFYVKFSSSLEDQSVKIKAVIDNECLQMGQTLTDNSYLGDGYRFHDVFHLAYAAALGWSPVCRATLGRKRKSNFKVDEVEDGGRAIAIEEGISALVFSYAKKHNFLQGIESIDYDILKTIKLMTEHLEVKRCSAGDWQRAILEGFAVWRKLDNHQTGIVTVSLDKQSLQFSLQHEAFQETILSDFTR